MRAFKSTPWSTWIKELLMRSKWETVISDERSNIGIVVLDEDAAELREDG